MDYKANRTGTNNVPPRIENLGDGTFFYNFNVEESEITPDDGDGEEESYPNWDYCQVRMPYPVKEKKIQKAVDDAGFEHTVKLEDDA